MDWESYFYVFFLATFKFILAPLAGASLHLSVLETVLATSAGTTSSALFFSWGGSPMRLWLLNTFFKKRKTFTPRNRRIVRIWRKYGLMGIAFLTPLLFSPILGTLIAVSFGEKKTKIVLSMALSALFWSLIFSFVLIEWGYDAVKSWTE
jgi:membrane protease YdiL (CAAX protease family)